MHAHSFGGDGKKNDEEEEDGKNRNDSLSKMSWFSTLGRCGARRPLAKRTTAHNQNTGNTIQSNN